MSKHLLPSLLVLTTTALSTLAPAQDWGKTHNPADLQAFAAKQFSGRALAPVSAVYREARNQGWLRSPTERKLIKQQLRKLAKSNGSRGHALRLQPQIAPAPTAGAPVALAGAEAEYNDSEGFANDLGTVAAPATATGTLSSSADTDTFRFTLILDAVVTFSLSASGGSPSLQVTNANGDENWGYHLYGTSAVLHLPAGTYHAQVGGTGSTTTYTLGITPQLQPIPTLGLGNSTQINVGGNPGVVKLVLPTDGRLNLQLTTANTLDTFLLLQNSQWGYVYEVDDTSTTSSGEAGLDAQLPAGTYYAYVFALSGTSTTTVKATFTAQATPVLTTSANGNLVGSQETFDLYRINVTNTEKVQVTITGTGSLALIDSYAILYDANMKQILEADDRLADTYSDLRAVLPPGTYYVASDSLWDYGTYTISRSTASASTVTAQAGTNPGTVAGDDTVTYAYSTKTPQWVEVNLVDGSGFDGEVGIVDANTGRSFGWEDIETLGTGACTYGVMLPVGDYYFQVRDYAGSSGSFDLQIIPTLQRWANDNVIVRGHEGNILYFLISLKSAPPSNPLPGLVSGNLLLDLTSAFVIPLGMPSGGILDLKASLTPNSGPLLQVVDIDAATLLGVYSNLLK